MNARARGSTEATATPGTAASVDDLVRRAQQGDVAAFESLYRTHAQAIYALCWRMTGDERDARELLQDVFVRAWERLTTFRGQSSLATWLHRLGTNVVLERMRVGKREALRMIDAESAEPETPGSDRDADTRMDLDRALTTLPSGARTVFVLHDIEGYSHDEIATMTGIAPGTARAQLWRARRALMRLLDL
jgi:RNA polymerase sigma-70 factor (ECF subfamily)